MKLIIRSFIKWMLIFLIVVAPFYLLSMLITGPLASYEMTLEKKLDQLYSKTAFNQCEYLDDQSLQSQRDLARCTVLNKEIWLLLDDQQNIISRLNMNNEELIEVKSRLLNQYQSEELLFSYYQDAFVYHLKNKKEELFITIQDERVILSVKLSHE
jgi:hypothetical protein